MGVRNYLIEGVSGSGKTSVAEELQRRGYQVVHGDRALAYKGDPVTGKPLGDSVEVQGAASVAFSHKHHLWDVEKVRALTLDTRHPMTFFCGGSRNFHQFVHLFDGVFVLEVDLDTLMRRLAKRPPDEFGGVPAERALIARLHATKEDLPPNAMTIDATAALVSVVDAILLACGGVEGGHP
ncbi:MAG: AAA family ATPase [Tabrizicola sp.]|nr:AAA family ATPase [Tabrizicola sp.]